MQKNKKCMHCFMEFKSVSSFLAHLGTNHHPTVSFSTSSTDSKSGEPICIVCRKAFASIKLLQQHIQQPCKRYWASEEHDHRVSTIYILNFNVLTDATKGEILEYLRIHALQNVIKKIWL